MLQVLKETCNLPLRSCKIPTKQSQKSYKYLPRSYNVLICFLRTRSTRILEDVMLKRLLQVFFKVLVRSYEKHI